MLKKIIITISLNCLKIGTNFPGDQYYIQHIDNDFVLFKHVTYKHNIHNISFIASIAFFLLFCLTVVNIFYKIAH